jgi:two-component system OmpR family response regulator
VKILLVEDDEKMAAFIRRGLKEAGFAVDQAADGDTALHLATTYFYDTAIVDLMIPGIDGLTLIDSMRRQKIHTPVIILSAKRTVDDRITGLRTGSDDYLTKPFSFAELLARVQALIRRASGSAEPSSFQVADLSLNLLTRAVYRGDHQICLQPLEFSLLSYLMQNAGRVVSKTMIMERVWNYNFDPRTNVVEARICTLRDKVDNNFEPKLIHTLRGVGYVLKAPD